jgi:hypothetical protein
MSESNPAVRGILWFVAGCGATALLYNFIIMPPMRDAAIRQEASELGRNVQTLQNELQSVKNQLQSANADRDTCKSKFERATILYDVGILNGETRSWILPVDIEPKSVGVKRGTYSHYDPKTQTETVHFQAKP